MDHLCSLRIVFAMLFRLFIAALWSLAGKGLTSWLSFVMFYCVLSLSHVVSWVWYLIVSIPDLFHLSYGVTLLHMSGLIDLQTDWTQETNKTKHHLYINGI